MIDEKKLIEKLDRLEKIASNYRPDVAHVCTNLLCEITDFINEQAKVGEWIPVSERLPEQSLNSVIGWDTYRERCVFVQYYMNEWILGNHESVNIVAWQPLPKPFKGETE